MILQIGEILEPLAQYAALFVIILGVMWIIFGVYEGKRRGSFKKRKVGDWDQKITKLLKGLTFLGFIVGLLSVIVGITGILHNKAPSIAYATITGEDKVNYFTSILLIIVGMITFIKPANDLPIATMIALLVASALIIVITLLIPGKYWGAIDILGFKIVVIIIFVIIFAITAVTVKFFSAGFMAASKAVSWPPLAIILSLFCFLQGFLLLVSGISVIPV